MKYSVLIYYFYLPGVGVGGGPEWNLPADEVQTEQHIFLSQLHHPASCLRTHQRCVPLGQRFPRLVAEPQGFHLSAGTGEVVCVSVGICMYISVLTVHNKMFFFSSLFIC